MNANRSDVAIKTRLMVGAKNAAWVVLAALAILACVGWFASSRHGSTGLLAAVAASLICLIPAVFALGTIAVTAGTANAMSGTFLSMILRTGLPFLVTILLCQMFVPLADVGLFGMVLVNYLLILIVETALAVRLVNLLSPKAVQ